MNCKICGSNAEKKFDAKIMHKYDAVYYHCKNCGFLFTGNPYWLDESYKSAINISDTGIMDRNIHYSKLVSVLLYFFFDKKAKYLDYAGGYGIFTRLMRDIGFDFYWQDPYCENLLSRGFEYTESMKGEIKLLTAFEVFEHLVNPLEEIEKMLNISRNIVFSTVFLPSPVPDTKEWWYYGFDHGQHVSFYSHKSISFIASKYGLNFYSYKDLHLLTKKNLNDILLKTLIQFCKLGLSFYVKRSLKSKTWEDHLLLKKEVSHKNKVDS